MTTVRPTIDVELVRRLVAQQFSHWADRPLRPVDVDGWDNRTFRLGTDMTARLPSDEGYLPHLAKEHRWLPALAQRLPLPIPVPLAQGAPALGYAFVWSIYGWIEGDLARVGRINDLTGFATDLPATWNGESVWFHGDVAVNNLLVRDGRLSAVIDFGCSGVGDPACDVTIANSMSRADAGRSSRPSPVDRAETQ